MNTTKQRVLRHYLRKLINLITNILLTIFVFTAGMSSNFHPILTCIIIWIRTFSGHCTVYAPFPLWFYFQAITWDERHMIVLQSTKFLRYVTSNAQQSYLIDYICLLSIILKATTYRETRFDYQRANYEADVWDILLKMADEGSDAFMIHLGATVERWKQKPFATIESVEPSPPPTLPSMIPPGLNIPRIKSEISRRVHDVVFKNVGPKRRQYVKKTPQSNWFLGCIKETLVEAQSEASEAFTRAQSEASGVREIGEYSNNLFHYS